MTAEERAALAEYTATITRLRAERAKAIRQRDLLIGELAKRHPDAIAILRDVNAEVWARGDAA